MLNRDDIGATKLSSSGLTLDEFVKYWKRNNIQWRQDILGINELRNDLAEASDIIHELLEIVEELKQPKNIPQCKSTTP